MQPCQQVQEIKEIRKELSKRAETSILHDERIVRMQEDITDIKEGQVLTNQKIDKLIDSVNEKFERLERKFASKWVEWVVKGLIGLILASVFGALIKLVIIKI